MFIILFWGLESRPTLGSHRSSGLRVWREGSLPSTLMWLLTDLVLSRIPSIHLGFWLEVHPSSLATWNPRAFHSLLLGSIRARKGDKRGIASERVTRSGFSLPYSQGWHRGHQEQWLLIQSLPRQPAFPRACASWCWEGALLISLVAEELWRRCICHAPGNMAEAPELRCSYLVSYSLSCESSPSSVALLPR